MHNKSRLKHYHSKPIFEELEARQLFSAGVEGLLAEQMPVPEATTAEVAMPMPASENQPELVLTLDSKTAPYEIVIVDTSVEGYQTLIDDITNNAAEGSNIEVIQLDDSKDGIAQITEILAGRDNLDAIHIISHGSDGSLDLGNSQLNFDTLIQNQTDISGWGDAFNEGGDILLYGCNVAETQFGQSFVEYLSGITNTEVAASTDATGSSDLGGDWLLEYETGSIETQTAVSAGEQSEWSGLMAVTSNGTVSSTSSTNVGLTSNQLTWSHTVNAGTNRAMFVEISIDGLGANVTGVTYGGVALTQVGRSTGNHAIEIWALVNPTVGTANVVVSFAGSTAAAAGATTFNGVNQSSAYGTFVGASGTGTSGSVTVTSAIGDVVIDSQYWQGKPSGGAAGSGQSIQWWAQNDTMTSGSTIETATSTSVVMNTNFTSSTYWQIAGVSVKAAANTAPVNTVPPAQTTNEDTTKVFSSANGNAITIADADAGGANNQITLTVTNGTLTLAGTTGLTFVAGDGTADSTMTLRGTASAINTALNGMSFTPTAEYSGGATLTVATKDSVLLSLDIDTALLGRYAFENTGVLGTDSSPAAGYTGSVVNGTAVNDASRGNVLSLAGDGYVQTTGLYGQPSSVTLAAWVNLTSADTGGAEVISLGDNVILRLDAGGKIKGSYVDSGTYRFTEATATLAGTGWRHVAYTIDSVAHTQTVYIDGVAVASTANTTAIAYSTGRNSFIGKHGNGGTTYDFNGKIDEARVYNRALTTAEIATLAKDLALTDTDTVAITVTAVNDAPSDLYSINGIPESSLVGVYGFNNPSNLGRDDAGNNAPITFYGNPGQTTGPSGSGALDLAGGTSGQYGDLVGITTGGAMTFAASVRFDSTGDWQRVFDFGQTNSSGIGAIYVGRSGNTSDLTFTIEKDLGGGVWQVYRATATNAITNGNWMHFTATVDGSGNMALYVNGSVAATTVGVAPDVGVRTNNYIGKSNWGGDAAFDGAIDNFVIANGAMSASQVAALYQQTTGFTISENAANGTVVGTVVGFDIDASANPTYSLTDSAGGRFAIGIDGTLTVADGSRLDYETAASHTITVRVSDASGATYDENFTIQLLNVNEAPVISGIEATTLAYTENGAATAITSTLVLADVDSANLSSATVRISANYVAGQDVLAFTNQNGITGSWNASTGVLTLTGSASVANYQAALRSVTYVNTADNPSNTARTISITVNDGAVDSNSVTRTISVASVNDAPSFSVGTGRNYTVISGMQFGNAVTQQADGKYILVGWSDGAGTRDFAVARYNTDGMLDTSFGGGNGYVITAIGSGNEEAQDVKVLANGKILVVGYAENGFGYDVALVQYNADGTLDTSFGSGTGKALSGLAGSDDGYSFAVQSDGKILVAGSYSSNFMLMRFNSNGAVDTSFGTSGVINTDFSGGNDVARSMVLQSDGKIVVAGQAFNSTTYADFAVARYNSDGSLDTSFNATGKVTVDLGTNSMDYGYGVALQADGKLLLSGFTDAAGTSDNALIRLNTNGSLDTSFGGTGKVIVPIGSGSDFAQDVKIQGDGKILTSGYTSGSSNDFSVVRYNSDGTLDTTFGGTGKVTTNFNATTDDRGNRLFLQGDGKIVVAGCTTQDGTYDLALARYNSDGSLDTSFNPTSNTLGSTVSYTENAAGVVIDSDVQIFDSELSSSNFNGLTLTIARNGGANSQDVFGATGSLTSLTEGGNLVVGGSIIGTVTTNSNGTLLLTFNSNATNTLANSAIRQITYRNTSDAPPASVQLNWTLNDANTGTQGAGGALTATGTTTINITGVNDAPSGTDKTLTIDEDSTYTLTAADFGFSDTDGNSFARVWITNLPAQGELLFNGATFAVNNWVVKNDLDLGLLTFKPVANANGSSYASFTFQVQDDGGTANGGLNRDPSNNTITFNVNAVNDAPVLSGIETTMLAYSENDPAKAISSTLVLTDVDSTTINSATVQLSTGYILGEDKLSFTNTANITGSWDASTGTMTLTGVASVAEYQAALRAVAYEDLSEQASQGQLTVLFTVNNDITSNTVTRDVYITSVNDTPVVNSASLTLNEGQTVTLSAANFSVSDPDNLGFTYTVSNISGGYFQLSTATGTPITSFTSDQLAASQVQFVHDGNEAAPSFSVTVNDGELSSNTLAATINYSAVNDAPVLSPYAPVYNLTEDSAPVTVTVATVLGSSASDVDATAAIGLAITDISGSGGSIDYSLDGGNSWVSVGIVSETSALLLRSTDLLRLTPNGQNGGIVITTHRAWDQTSGVVGSKVDVSVNGGTTAYSAASDSVTITIASVNDAPVFSNLNGSPTFIENGSAVVLDADVTIFDVELSGTDNFNGSTLTLARHGGANSEDALAFDGITVTVSGPNVYVSGVQVGTYSFTGGQMDITFGANATNARVNTLMQNTVYWNWSETPPASVQIDWTFNDVNAGAQGSGGALMTTGSTTVNITGVNDAPVLSAIEGTTLAYTENGSATAITATLALSDADNTNLSGATVQMTGNYASGQDVLAFTDQNGITGSWDSSTGTLTLSGTATVTQYQTALRSITYQNTSDAPSTASRTVSFSVTDGTTASNIRTRSISVAAVNDAPTATITPTSYSATEQTSLTLHGTGLSIADVDASSSSVQATLSVVAGTLTASAGTTGVSVSGSGSGSVILTGTVSQINDLLAGNASGSLSYIINSDTPPATDTLTLSVNDQGNTGSGGALSGFDVATINIAAVNDAPVNTVYGDGTSLPEESVVQLLGSIEIADVDSGSGTVTTTLSVSAGAGVLSAASASGVTISGSGTDTLVLTGDVASINAYFASAATAPVFTATADYNGAVSFTVVTTDNGNSGSGGALSDSDTISGSISAVADIANDSVTTNEDTPVTFDPLANDAFENSGRYISAIDGTSISSGQTVATTGGNVTLNANGTLTFTPTANSNGATSFSYTVTAGGATETATVAVTVNPVNDVPVLNLTDNAFTFVENASHVRIGSSATLADVDSSDFAGGTLTVTISGNGAAEDRLFLVTQGTGAGQVQVVGSDVFIDGNLVATTAGGVGAGSPLIVSFSVNADASSVQAVTNRVSFRNVSDNPSGLQRTVEMVVTDGDGGTSNTDAVLINVTPVNDAPIITASSLTLDEGQTVTLSAANFGVTDPDNTSFTYTVSNVSGGYFQLSTATGVAITTFSSAQLVGSQVQFVDDGNEVAPSFSVTVSDGSANSNTLAATINYTAVNEAPTDIVATRYLSEQSYLTQSLYTLTLDKGHSGNPIVLDGVSYARGLGTHPGPNGNDYGYVDYAVNGATSFKATIGINDYQTGLYGSVRFYVYVDGVQTYSSPVLDSSSKPIDLNINVAGASTIRLAVDNANNGNAFDHGVWANARLEGGTVALASIAENTANGSVVGSVVGVDNDLRDNWSYALINDAGGRFAINANTGQITVANGSLLNYEAATSHDIIIQATDTGGLSLDKTFTISLTDVNEAPVLTSASLTLNEGDTVTLSSTNFGVTDPDNASFTYTVSSVSGGYFQLSSAAGNSITQFTSADLSSGLVQFVDDGNEVAPSFSVTVSDGNLSSNTLAATINYSAVNDAPVISSASLTVSEGQTVTLSVANFGVTDPDNASLTYTVSNVVGGYFQLTSTAGTSITSFTTTQLVAGQVQFVDDGNEVAPSFSVMVNDGVTDSNTVVASVSYTPVNDAPHVTWAGDYPFSTNEDAPSLGISVNTLITNGPIGSVGYSDVDGSSLKGMAVIATTGNGTWEYSIDGVSWTDFGTVSNTQALLLDGNTQVRYVPNGTNEVAKLQIRGWDQSTGTASTSGSASYGNASINDYDHAYSYEIATVTCTVSSVNDAPSGADTTVTTNEDTAYSFSRADFGFTDTDGNTFIGINITSLPGAGSLTLNGIAVTTGQTISTTDIDLGVLQFSPAVNANSSGYTSFTFQVQDDGGSLNGGVDLDPTANRITVNVTAVNDAPVLSGASLTLNEGDTVTLSLANFGVSDPDNASFTYTVSSVSGGYFQLSSAAGNSITQFTSADLNSGLVQFVDDGNEVAPSFSVTVSDGALNSNTLAATINYTAVNDNAPVITSGSSASVNENSSVSTVVYTASGSDADGNPLTWSLSGTDAALLSIDASTGEVTLNAAADYESKTSCSFNVVASDGTLSSSQAVTLSVTNLNDNPVSAVSDSNATANRVAENAASGTVVGITALASDADSGATISYSLTDSAGGRFAIDSSTGVVTVADGSLLDYETATSHSITVLATSSDVSSNSQSFTINVTNLNDNAPVISSGSSASVNENSPINTVVYTATGSDADGNALTWSLSGTDAALLSIDATTGEVTFKAPADYESKTSYSFNVIASDGTLSSSQAVTLSVTNLNDNPVSAVSDSNATANSVAENAANGTVVGITALASDADSGATISYSLTDSAGGRFAIDSNTGVVTVADGSLLDYETATSHSITVLATSSDGSSNSQSFTISVTNLNDNPVSTVSDSNATANSVAENAASGTVVGITALASDADSGATISYSLTDSAGGRFAIDSNSGVVTVADGSLLDYETATSHSITLLATSSDGSTNNQTFSIAVTNVNDNPVSAVSDSNATANRVAENAASGTVVGITALASDADSGATISYSLTDSAGGRFAIDSNTGVVTVADGSLLNYEAATSHDITVRATSSDGSTNDQTFSIAVTNVNDNAPVITSGSSASVNENSSVSTVVYTANGSDADGNPLTWSLSGTDAALLSVDASTGEVTLNAAADYESKTSYSFSVIASDGTFNSSQAVTLSVTNVNDNPVSAVSDSNATANSVAENAASGTVVGITALASDADSGATISYSLTDSAGGRFAIDSNSGVVTVADGSLLDYETATSHSITVLATSSDGSSNSQSFTISVTNLNDNPVSTVSDSNATANSVAENAASGTVVGITALASDADSGATISYSLTDTAGGRFAIDSSTGVVTVADGSLLDYEAATSHSITVLATSSDGSSNSQSFTINVTNLNDNPVSAVSDSNATPNSVNENAANGSVVGITALATDADVGATLSYSLTDTAGGRFAIDSSTGVVTVADGSLLDYETATGHSITVLATSSDGSTNSQTFSIAVTNLNDNPVSAVSDSNATANSVAENAANGTVAGITALATDADVGATLSYSLTDNAGGRFAIDSSTGVVTVADGSLLDYEAATSHDITVRATSSDGSTNDQTFSIAVTNVNDNPVSVVSDSNATANSVSENAANGSVVGITALATDADVGATLSYSLTDNAGGRFAIDSSTGVVTVADGSLLDYEAATSHSITVLATSSDGSTNSQTFSIAVTNVNDNPVSAVSDSNATANSVAENAANGTVVGITALATDADAGTTLSYSLTDTAGGCFAIDSSTGVVTVANGSLLNYEAATSHDITVRATSSDGSTNDQTFSIAVTNVNDNAPILNGARLTISEGQTVTLNRDDIDITDLDAHALTYRLSDISGGYFQLASAPGVSIIGFDDAALASGQVQFVHDGSETVPGFKLSVNDGFADSNTLAVTVNYTAIDDPVVPELPDFSQNPAPSFSDNSPEPQPDESLTQADADPIEQSATEASIGDAEVIVDLNAYIDKLIAENTMAYDALADSSVFFQANAEHAGNQGSFLAMDNSASYEEKESVKRRFSSVTSGLSSIEFQTIDTENTLTEAEEKAFWHNLETISKHMDSPDAVEEAKPVDIKVVLGASVSLTAGFVSWVLRAGSLMASFMSTVPLLRRFDPLPILKTAKNHDKHKVNVLSDGDEDTDSEESD